MGRPKTGKLFSVRDQTESTSSWATTGQLQLSRQSLNHRSGQQLHWPVCQLLMQMKNPTVPSQRHKMSFLSVCCSRLTETRHVTADSNTWIHSVPEQQCRGQESEQRATATAVSAVYCSTTSKVSDTLGFGFQSGRETRSP